ncbi:MAG: hypothetical protein LIO85_05100 [Rikenellaceae bacterium]|nr:hypothetical protein [Rikenellaceae bacterium]
MKLKKYILLFAVFAAGVFTACDDDNYVEPVLSPSVQLGYIVTPDANEILVTITPSRSVATFRYAIGQDEDRDAFLDGTLPGIATAEGSEQIETRFTGLQEKEVYTIFARGFASDGTAGPLALLKVKTRGELPELVVSTQFVGETSAGIYIDGHTNYYKYIFALGRKGDRETFEKGILDGTREKTESAKYAATYFDLDMDSEYVFFLTAYDRLSNQPTETIEVPFRTAAKGTVPAVAVTLDHIDIYSSDYTLTPNALCKRFGVTMTFDEEFEDAAEGDTYKGNMFEMFWAWDRSKNGYITRGYGEMPFQFTTPAFMLGTDDAFNHELEMYIIVYGDDEETPVAIQKHLFETPAYDDNMGEADATITVTDIHDHGAMYEFEVNEYTMGLVYETVDEEWYEDLLKSGYYYDGYMEDLIFFEGYWNYTHSIRRTSFPEATASPGRNYRVFYMPMNYNGPFGGLGKMKSYSYTTTGTRTN